MKNGISRIQQDGTFNRTIVELKLTTQYVLMLTATLLIVP